MKLKGRAIRYYFGHLEGFDRGHFDHLDGRLSAKFSKTIDRCKHCISSEGMYFE